MDLGIGASTRDFPASKVQKFLEVRVRIFGIQQIGIQQIIHFYFLHVPL